MKLIIDIDDDYYKALKNQEQLPNRLIMEMAITEGTPLDDIKTEIADIYVGYRHGYEIRKDALEIIDSYIGKEKE